MYAPVPLRICFNLVRFGGVAPVHLPGGAVASRRATHPEATAGRSFTVGQARGTYTFWIFAVAVQMLGLTVMSIGVVMLAPGWPGVVVIAGNGLAQGIFGITTNIAWPRFFGRAHLGAVSGLAMALSVAGSAIGPFLFSAGHDALGSYAPAVVHRASARWAG